MVTQNKIMDCRRKRLAEWIADKFEGRQAGFLEKTGGHQGELSALLGNRRPFGEKKARSIEALSGMPPYWLDGGDATPVIDDGAVAEFAWVYNNASESGKAFLRRTVEASKAFIEVDRRSAATPIMSGSRKSDTHVDGNTNGEGSIKNANGEETVKKRA